MRTVSMLFVIYFITATCCAESLVFDKYCIQCHDYGKVEKNLKMPNLAGDLHTIFSKSCVTLYKNNLIKPIGAGLHNVLMPYTWRATQSELAEVMLTTVIATKRWLTDRVTWWIMAVY
ncbi:hypothetical protein FACS1894170_12860 [Planctomycetales bacterium]|nr:hypothetical protein FACS1894170_12860 [Planctomycetales bacterium]